MRRWVCPQEFNEKGLGFMQTNSVEGFRLSPQQRRLWSLWGRHENAPYRVQCAALIEGSLDASALRAAVEDVAARHEILHTTFQNLATTGMPIQVINERAVAWEPDLDLAGAPESELQSCVDEVFEALKGMPFDLSTGPLLRASLVHLQPDRKMLLLALPALCTDAAGAKNLLREIAARCDSGLAWATAEEEPLQYADISEYLSSLLDERSAGAEYWTSYDLAELSARRLHFQRGMSRAQGAEPPIQVRLRLGSRMADLALACDSTPELFMLSCWHALLWRITGWREIVVGVAFDGRRVEGLGALPGAFVKYLPLEAKPEAGDTFAQLLANISERAATHAEWQDYFDWGEAGKAKEAKTHLPLGFDYEEIGERHRAGAAVMSLQALYFCNEPFDLKLSCVRVDRELFAEFHFDARLFDRREVECLAAELAALAMSAAANPNLPISELDLHRDGARDRLVHEFNQTRADYSRSRHVHQLVEEHARTTPDAFAVVYDEQRLSYTELNTRANRLAHYLIARGVGSDILVGICLDRSPEMIVALLAVLKAGGAYLPLDATYPKARLRFMTEDAQLSLLITQRRLAERLTPGTASLIIVDEERESFEQQSDENPKIETHDDNLAYIIYTSGSTGRPKGVMISRGGLLNYLSWSTEAYRVAEGCGAPVHSSLAFDLTITSLFPSLMAGRSLLLLGEDESAGDLLAQSLRGRPKFSLVKITPAHLEVLSLLMKPDEVGGAATALVVGGEALHWENLSFWRTHAPAMRIINEYGPTETVVGCCVYEVEAAEETYGSVPIGRAIANTRMYVLDDRMEPSPFLVAGEIYIGGAGLARGYVNRPDLTAEKFVPDLFGGEPGARLYRTGDLGRYRADGTIEFLGRCDHQVKIKGYRIELGEVEVALLDLAEVREAVVIVREDTGEKRLVGYVVPRDGLVLSASDLQRRLRERLPEYMVPSTMVILGELPLTINGKVDRDALPVPGALSSDGEKGYVPPRTPGERLLAELWAKSLRLDRVGVHDNFFELGGDSILSIQIANRGNLAGVRLTPRQIFQNRTIAELACVIEAIQPARTEEASAAGPVPFTPIQHWFFEQDLPEPQHWNQSAMLELRRVVKPSVLEKALQLLILHHDALRLRFAREQGRWRQVCAPPGEGQTLTRKSLAAVAEEEQEAAIVLFGAEFQKTLNLSEGPIMRAALIDLGPGKASRLLLAIHHLAVDVVSWGVLLEGLQLACDQLGRGETVSLPSKTTSFKSWAERLEKYAKSEDLREEQGYWMTELDRWSCKLPVDWPEGINSQESARIVWVSLDSERTKALLQEVPRVYHTMINDVLLTALVQSFSAWTRSRSLLVDLENHGREDIFDDVDLSRTVGWFTCIFPLLLELGDASRPDAVLKSVKEQIRRVPNGGIGYGLLRYIAEDTESDRLRRLQQAEICFNYLGRAGQIDSEHGLFAPKGSPGPTRNPAGRRRYLIEVDGGIYGDQLRMAWTYSENLHARSTIEGFATGFIAALNAIIDHCLSVDAGGFTPSDFSIPDLSQRELDKLIAELSSDEEQR